MTTEHERNAARINFLEQVTRTLVECLIDMTDNPTRRATLYDLREKLTRPPSLFGEDCPPPGTDPDKIMTAAVDAYIDAQIMSKRERRT